jgi:mevalonate kinase
LKSISSAPGKVILFGEHFIVYGGKAILCSINKRITVESQLSNSDKIEISSGLGAISVSKNEPLQNIDSVFRPVIYVAQKILQKFNSDSGLKISITSEIPAGVGLGSSSACCVAAASSISGLFSNYSKEEVLQLALEAEKTIFENVSGADSTVCTYGGIIEYSRDGKIKKLDFVPKFQLVVADSKIMHSTSQVVSKVKKFKDDNPQIFSMLCDKEFSLIEETLVALKKNDLNTIGAKMNQNQAHLEKIGVSNDLLGSMLGTVNNVAYGAKMTGAGDGGCIIALADETNLNRTIEALRSKNYECFAAQIDTTGVEQKIEDKP